MTGKIWAMAAALACAASLGGSGAAWADKIKHPTAVFAGLDKITGRIITFEVAIDETVQFGSLQIFADSPGMHGIEHPVYDIWLTDCKGGTQIIHEAPEVVDAPSPEPPEADLTAAPPDAKPTPAPKKRKPKPAANVETSPLDLGGAPSPAPTAAPAPPAQRNPPTRRFFPTDAAPIPPANVGQ
ncbi:MAG: DUF2155 domain-containing protein [Roseiarcus sp.]